MSKFYCNDCLLYYGELVEMEKVDDSYFCPSCTGDCGFEENEIEDELNSIIENCQKVLKRITNGGI